MDIHKQQYPFLATKRKKLLCEKSNLSLLAFFVFFFTIFSKELKSQSLNIFTTLTQVIPQQGKVVINQSHKIEQLVLNYIAYTQSTSLSGYRIRIFSASGTAARARAYGERERFLSLYPGIPVYIEYEAPNFKLYVGDYRNRHEAFKALKQISQDFTHAFIVPSIINLPKIE